MAPTATPPADDPLPPAVEQAVRQALLATYYKGSWVIGNDSELARNEIHDHVRGRFDTCRRWLLPWIRRAIDLRRSRVVEIGCGTASTTAALALEAEHVTAYDIHGPSVEAARQRLELMGLRNVALSQHPAADLLPAVSRGHAPGSVDVVLIYAVLEHATHVERLETLRRCWALLRPGGVLVVGDTPNRLTYWDAHTTHLPFFNCLPADLALDYAFRSPRQAFKDDLAYAKSVSPERAADCLARWGRGVSYHEFELALGELEPLIVGDGFDPEPLAYYGVSLETRILYTYARRKGLAVPPAFLRETIEVILRKPDGTAPPRPARDLDAIVRPLRDDR